MLGELLESLADLHPVFGVFRYVTVRTAAAAVTAIVLSLGLGRPLIRLLTRMKVGEKIRDDGPARHHAKAGTPTMGGFLIVAAVTVSTLLWADPANPLIQTAALTVLAFAGLGFADDLKKHRTGKGLRAPIKLGIQAVIALAVAGVLLWLAASGAFSTRVIFPFIKQFQPELGWWLMAVVVAVLVGSSNAVNLTDGLDGLAAGSVLVAAGAFTVLNYLSGHAVFSEYLDIVFVPGASELTIFGAAICGATLGFLWFNAHPAQVFMGDVGSLALGAAVGMQALLIRQEFLLLLVGGVFVVEAVSVILQVTSLKLTGRRVFRMTPIHHHFEQGDWPETRITVRFWILSVLCALATVTTLKIR